MTKGFVALVTVVLMAAMAAAAVTEAVPLPTADEIIADGVVSTEERHLARRVVFECIRDAGADTTLELFDVDPVVARDYGDELHSCSKPYAGLYHADRFPRDRFSLGLLGIVECVEDRTGRNFGEKTVDEIGRLTDASRTTIEAALSAENDIFDECTVALEAAQEAGDGPPTTPVLEYRFDGGNARRLWLRISDCGYNTFGNLVEETATEVIVAVTSLADRGGDCWIRHPVRLEQPLGDRPLIDEHTGEPVAVSAG